ncbi:MAG: hypothetical protein IT355_13050 [Gemmatimonadaceae bacterium]|nr:hypothetical protein [Gemmatimonadaceae bacterium]
MTNPEDLQLPRDPGPMPAALRDAFGWARDAERASSSMGLPESLDVLADPEAADEARLAVIEQLLATPAGARELAHVVAARASTAGTPHAYFTRREAEPAASRAFAAAAPRGRGAMAGLKPILLAASLILVAGTSWYVYTLPEQETAAQAIRSAGSAVELLAVPPMPATAPITLSWKMLRTDDRYTVEVLDASDAPVFTGDTHTTRLVIPAATLKRGTYRWFVRARGTDRSEIRSRVESFTVR